MRSFLPVATAAERALFDRSFKATGSTADGHEHAAHGDERPTTGGLPGDAMGQAARRWHHRRWISDGAAHAKASRLEPMPCRSGPGTYDHCGNRDEPIELAGGGGGAGDRPSSAQEARA